MFIYKGKLFSLKKSGHLENIILAGISQSEKRQILPDLTHVESKWNVPEAGVGEGSRGCVLGTPKSRCLTVLKHLKE